MLEIANGDYGNFLDIMRKGGKTTEWLHQLPPDSKGKTFFKTEGMLN